ncbi:hypothetical protein [Clostridium sp. JN-9]|uniref:hypothetical protein n=1 Tax=Clostridium sp. JN-9 TaxID=2507159 RepID=UPI000FFE0B5F|nr:hypothetical protein [Clostridium sp. JN-9]QAT40708.1 hypothetical protein EQM05_10780 [Clostridium sp. JN-9]
MATLFVILLVGLILYAVFSIIGLAVLPLAGVALILALILSILGLVFKIVFSKPMLILIIILFIIYTLKNK